MAPDAAALEDLAARCSNRGRWDAEEPPSALALITRARLLEACALPRRGLLVSCGLSRESGAPDGVHSRLLAPRPAPAGVAGRGVLLDLPRVEGRAPEPGEAVAPERLDACAESLGVTLQAGDLLLLRTGALERARGDGWEGYRHGATPGLDLACATWLHRREVALVGSDARSVQALAVGGAGAAGDRPLEDLLQRHAGVLLGHGLDLDGLAAACARDGDYAFLLVAPPLPHAGPNPAQPVALK